MNMITQKLRQAVGAGNCEGKINDTEVFSAGLVELSERTFPLPHGEAYVMFARQREPRPEYTTKELTLSFTKGLQNGSYDLKPDTHQVRLTFADNSDPAKPVTYTQRSGDGRSSLMILIRGLFPGILNKGHGGEPMTTMWMKAADAWRLDLCSQREPSRHCDGPMRSIAGGVTRLTGKH